MLVSCNIFFFIILIFVFELKAIPGISLQQFQEVSNEKLKSHQASRQFIENQTKMNTTKFGIWKNKTVDL